jgi:hypothetical protein
MLTLLAVLARLKRLTWRTPPGLQVNVFQYTNLFLTLHVFINLMKSVLFPNVLIFTQ